MWKIECSTLYDITETGVTGQPRHERYPFIDSAGRQVTDVRSWNRSRNQQRNLETILQLLSMRTQVESATSPVQHGKRWSFTFTVEHQEVFGENYEVLHRDASGVPMMSDLGEPSKPGPVLVPGKNIWFRTVEKTNEQG